MYILLLVKLKEWHWSIWICTLHQHALTTINLTLWRTKWGVGGGGRMPAPPHKFFLNLSETNYHLHRPFSVAVRVFLAHILIQNCWASVAMVMKYDMISSRWWSHFWRKMRVFPFFGRKKYEMCAKGGKMFDYITFLMFSKTTFNFLLFLSNSQFWWNPRWRPRWR